MGAKGAAAKGRKLSRAEIREVLERNAELYRDDENLVPYIVELAMYMLEYEYDWSESAAEPPDSRAAKARPHDTKYPSFVVDAPEPAPPPAERARSGPKTRGDQPAPPQEPAPPPPAAASVEEIARELTETGGPKIIKLDLLRDTTIRRPVAAPDKAKAGAVRDLLQSARKTSVQKPLRPKTTFRSCPYCGAPISDESICPQCRSMTR